MNVCSNAEVGSITSLQALLVRYPDPLNVSLSMAFVTRPTDHLEPGNPHLNLKLEVLLTYWFDHLPQQAFLVRYPDLLNYSISMAVVTDPSDHLTPQQDAYNTISKTQSRKR